MFWNASGRPSCEKVSAPASFSFTGTSFLASTVGTSVGESEELCDVLGPRGPQMSYTSQQLSLSRSWWLDPPPQLSLGRSWEEAPRVVVARDKASGLPT